MTNEIVTFRYNKNGTLKMKVWNMTVSKDVSNFKRYFRRNAVLGYQYDVLSGVPMIRFNSIHYFTRHQMFALVNGHCDSCFDSQRFFKDW